MKIYTELLKLLITGVILNYFLEDKLNLTTLFLLSFLIVYTGTIVADICMKKLELFQDQSNEIANEIKRKDVQEAQKTEAETIAKVYAENPNSSLLSQEGLTWTTQVENSKAGSLDPLYNATFSLTCQNQVSAGSQGWLCASPKLEDQYAKTRWKSWFKPYLW